MVTIPALAAAAAAAAATAVVVAASVSSAVAQARSTETNFFCAGAHVDGRRHLRRQAPPGALQRVAHWDGAQSTFECYRPRSPLSLKARARALVMTDEDDGGYPKCSGDVIALRFERAWKRPYFNMKPSFDVKDQFGTDYQLPARFGGSCDKARAELGIAELRYGPWGSGRPTFVRLLCIMTRLVRQLRDFRCPDINTPVYKPVQLDSPFATLVTFLENVAYLYSVSV